MDVCPVDLFEWKLNPGNSGEDGIVSAPGTLEEAIARPLMAEKAVYYATEYFPSFGIFIPFFFA